MAGPKLPFEIPMDGFFHSWYPIIVALVIGAIIGFRNYLRGPSCFSDAKMKGKTVIVTGANRGVGKETARELAARGARVILACRDVDLAKEAAQDIKETTKSKKVVCMKLDLASFKSIREFAEKVNKKEKAVHVLINNAGVMCYPEPEKTEDGHEIQFATNHLGPFLLTHLLLDKLKESAPSRIINTSALAHHLAEMDFEDLNYDKREFKPGYAYAQSKLAVMLFTRQLAKELEGTSVTVNAMHPGVVNTDAHRHMPFRQSKFLSVSFGPVAWYMMKAAKDGAQPQIYLAVATELEAVSGKYYGDCFEKQPDEKAQDDVAAKKLWDYSMKACGLSADQELKQDSEMSDSDTAEDTEETTQTES